MIALVALLTTTLHHDRVDLRVNGKVVREFDDEWNAKPARLYWNGKPTKIILDTHTYICDPLVNSKGRIAFTTQRISSGAVTVAQVHSFLTLRNKLEEVQFLPIALDQQDRVLGQTGNESMVDDTVPHAWLWQRGKTIDLGAAAQVRFGADGAIEGYAEVLKNGEEINGDMYALKVGARSDVYYRPFRWKNGKRSNGPISTTLPAAFRKSQRAGAVHFAVNSLPKS